MLVVQPCKMQDLRGQGGRGRGGMHQVLESHQGQEIHSKARIPARVPQRLFYEAVEAKLKWKDVRDPEDSCRHRVEPVGNKTGKVTQVLKPSESSDSFMRPRCQTWSYRIFGVCHPGLQKSCLTLSLLAVPPVLHFEREVFTLRQCLLEVYYLSLNFTGIKSLS